MKKNIFLLFIGVLLLSITSFSYQESITADQLVKIIDDNLTPICFDMRMAMKTIRQGNRDQDYEFRIFEQDRKTSLMVVTEPARERGKKILLVNDNLWMFIPGKMKEIRLSKKDSFMGSLFSNNDLMDTSYSDDYNASFIKNEETDKQLALLLNAKEDKKVAYAQVKIYTTKSKPYLPIKMVYRTRTDEDLKTMYFYDPEEIGGRMRPKRMEMTSILEEGAKTVVILKSLEEKKSFPKEYFNPSKLKNLEIN